MRNTMPKPAGSTWTDEQWEAICRTGEHILVAAAAGSGKTAVLVERIIRKICDEARPVDVDRLLVATFTKAAAAEMRERIRAALEKELLRNPKSTHLRKQLALINRASVTTLHSFCLEVIQRYFQLIRLDPGFRIANETESELMRQELLDELFEEHYRTSGEDSEFWKLVDGFGGERGDEALYKLVQRLYDFSRSHPWPEHWLRAMAARFDIPEGGSPGEPTVWQQSLMRDIRMELGGVIGLLTEAVELAGQPGGPAPYLINLHEDLEVTRQLAEQSLRSWDALYEAFRTVAFGKLKPCRGDDVDKSLQERVKALRDAAKEKLKSIQEELFARPPEVFFAELRSMVPVMNKLVDIVIEFGERYRAEKSAKGLVDFADLEHYCLQILRDPASTPERMIPSQAALDYREQFVEVLLDEYQDTNTVQEAIVELIANPEPGNRFMVGDVKQSIYRFRLAEPGLFLDKYKAFAASNPDEEAAGRKIDLARNFRSRREVVDAVNFIFRQMMRESVAELDYDERARLVCGASYPEAEGGGLNMNAEFVLIDRAAELAARAGSSSAPSLAGDSAEADEESGGSGGAGESEEEQLETVQLEARLIASRIRRMMGEGGKPLLVYDKRTGATRPAAYRDIVILLRATQAWAPVIIEEFRLQGIPAYADLSTGYFTATEVEIMLSLLKVIDNPFQDIPLAGVLRSPMFGLTEEELALIRIAHPGGSYFDAVRAYAKPSSGTDGAGAEEREEREEAATARDGAEATGTAGLGGDRPEVKPGIVLADHAGLRGKLRMFLEALERWRDEARQGSLADLIWRLYRETGYFDMVGGMPGGVQRQANLRALYDRARIYESTSFRGLFRFLRFIERMQDSGADLGTARALGEQEDVVRIMSIHKSKGLEFPVVFVAGLGKMFNQQDLNGAFLLHKELGFGPKYTDADLRVSYPTLPLLAIRRRLRMEMLAEEMRVLYVALTRAKEKLILVGTVKSLDKQIEHWARHLGHSEWALPDHELAKARCYLDWLGPALIRHPHAERLWERGGVRHIVPAWLKTEPSVWSVTLIGSEMAALAQAAPAAAPAADAAEMLEAIRRGWPVDAGHPPQPWKDEIERRLRWSYPHAQASAHFAKTTVSEMKRLQDSRRDDGEEAPGWPLLQEQRPQKGDGGRQRQPASPPSYLLRKPRFVERKAVSAVERGTIYHAVMQYLPLAAPMTADRVLQEVAEMVEKQLLSPEHRDIVDPAVVASFFETDPGVRLLHARNVKREVPFSYGLRAGDVYREMTGSAAGETVLVQGVIDCLFEEDGRWILLDYKTDAVYDNRLEQLKERYRLQIGLYAEAIERITGKPVAEKYLYFFDGGNLVGM